MIVLMFAAIFGGILTSLFAFSSLGILGSLAIAPVGGSLAALGAAVILASRKGEIAEEVEPVLLFSTDEQIGVLRQILDLGRRAAPAKRRFRNRAA
jgi:hypothetical protein